MSRTASLVFLNRISWWLSPLALLLIWALVANYGPYSRQLLVPPQYVWDTAVDLAKSGELLEHLHNSLGRLAIGFAIGAAAGLLFGIPLALSRGVQEFLGPLFHAIRQVPSIAMIPMFILFFGVEETFKIIIVIKAVFFPVALATSEGIKAIPRTHFEVASVYRLSFSSLILDVAFPAAAPPIVTGLRIALSRGWMVLVAAELLAADSGLGQLIEMNRQLLRLDVVMAGVIVTGLVGFTLDYGFRLLEQRLFRYKTR
jgi:sulfonate transport system permease protein